MIHTILTILFVTTLTAASGQVLIKFEFSECMTECMGDSTKIDRIIQTNDMSIISLTAYANCNGNLEGQIKLANDTLDLRYFPKVSKVFNKKTGKVDEIIEIAMCDCIFKFSYTIKGLKTQDKNKIKINGENLDKINKRTYTTEEIEIQSEIDTTWTSQEIFLVVENSATFSGGFAKFYDYIDNNLVYPKDAEKEGIKGKVFVEFVINKDGSIDDTTVKVLRGLNESCNNEAIRLMKECPNWIPGTMKGQPVKQKLLLPIIFKPLKDK
ncbi:MAG TPA: energy transducer TonB [Chryseolinea sp.]|nr:energy transducer TonB [Chryseolinea sp.]